jgi:hypothetical protein
VARTAEGGGGGALAMAVRPKCRWALAGLRLGRGGVRVGAGRAFGLGPGAREFSFFP